MEWFWLTFSATLAAVAGVTGLLFLSSRSILKQLFGVATRRILTETYSKNLWELISSSVRFTPKQIVELALRSESRDAIRRSMGTPNKMAGFDGILFLPAQLAVLPTEEDISINTKTVIGPKARRPLRLDIPLIVGGWGIGPALSDPMRQALAQGATKAGTAMHSGEVPLTEKERPWADRWIVPYGRAEWSIREEGLRQGDMIEIVVGSGAAAGTPFSIPGRQLTDELRERLGFSAGDTARIHSRVPGVDSPDNWPALVKYLREVGEGVPVGVKIVPSRVEEDVERALKADVDFITIDGAQGGIKESAPILQDDFGLPTVRGVVRALRCLEKHYAGDRVSVIASGGLYTPGDYLKVLALGADAVALDTVLLLGAAHIQITEVLPWEPLSQLVWYDGESAERLDVEQAAENVAKLLKSSVEEMKIAVTCLGKKSLREVSREDLVALDPETVRITGLPPAYERQTPSPVRPIRS